MSIERVRRRRGGDKRGKLILTVIGILLFIFVYIYYNVSVVPKLKVSENPIAKFIFYEIQDPVVALENKNMKLSNSLRVNEQEKREIQELKTKEFYEEVTRVREWNRQKTINVMNGKFAGALKNKGEFMYDISVKYKVNPIFIAAKFCWESAYGKSDLARNAFNPSGINWIESVWGPKGKGFTSYGSRPLIYVKFPSIEVGVEESIKLLKQHYINEGKIEVNGIGAKWAPPDDSRNGMHGMDNNAWVSGVSRIYNEMYNKL